MIVTEKNTQQSINQRTTRTLLLVTGCMFMLLALLYNEILLGLFITDLKIIPRAIPRIREVQLYFFLWGIVLFSLSECVRRVSWLKPLLGNAVVINSLLSVVSLTSLIVILEFSLRPFAYLPGKGPTFFIKDDLLGWKLRPNATDTWGKTHIAINSKGARGPEVEYAKRSHVKRILYLGDSVTFGFGLECVDAFPFHVGALLRETISDTIETVNTGVNGYSAWQEYLYLSSEGFRYQPDIVVVSFVLNDVTESISLSRFGVFDDAWQLASPKKTKRTFLDDLSGKSNILYFIRLIGAKIRFGKNLQEGARKTETIYVEQLAYSPDRPEVQEAWKVTFEDLGKIFNACKEHHTPVILVVFPFVFQFDNIEALSTPQRIVCNFARENNIPVIDLLPFLDERMKATGTKPEDYFLDDLHPSALGSDVVADTLAGFILAHRFLSHDQHGQTAHR